MVDKITSPITPLGEIDKINEIIDEVDKKLDKSGGNMTGNLSVNNSASITTNGYVAGTWLQTKSASVNNDLTTVAMLDGNGWIYKQSKDTLLSGTVKSVNNTSPDSNGNVTISIPPAVTESTVSGWGFTKNAGTVTSVNNVSPVNGNVTLSIPTQASDIGAQPTLISGTNIKTINNTSLLGSGNIDIQGGGSSRNIGEIVASTIPLTDAGLHLLDGALISGSGSYSEFVTYIAGLRTQYSSLFTTESVWQSAVSTYGVCGKFVYDSTNNTVRLPKYNSKIYTGGGTAPVVGNGIALGLSDGLNSAGVISHRGATSGGYSCLLGDINSFGDDVGLNTGGTNSTLREFYTVGVTTDPTKSGIIAQLSDITTSLDGYYYIVVATSTKTDIQVDIDEIATDLNGKADIDLSNVPNSKGILTESYVNGTSWYRVYSDGWCEQGGSITVNTGSATQVVTFLKPYLNTNYTLTFGTFGQGYNSGEANFRCTALTSSTCTFYNNSGTQTMYKWEVKGYIR